MKGFLQVCFVLLVSLSAAALEDGHAKYVGGTLPSATAGVVGRLDTTSEMSLVFLRAGNKVEIPYASIESYEYSKEVARHLGVLPMIAIGLVKMRQHRHFFRITYRAPGSAVPQVAIFEVPKHMPRTLRAVLDARAPHTDKSCKPCFSSNGEY
jgi:hypothetical protein